MEKPYAGYIYFVISIICGTILFFKMGYNEVYKEHNFLIGHGEIIRQLNWEFIAISLLVMAQGWVVLTALKYLYHISEK